MAKRRYAEQGACSPGDSVVACDVFLAYGEGMRLYVQDRHTEAMAIFLPLADKRREHTHSPLRSQAAPCICTAFFLREPTLVAPARASRRALSVLKQYLVRSALLCDSTTPM